MKVLVNKKTCKSCDFPKLMMKVYIKTISITLIIIVLIAFLALIPIYYKYGLTDVQVLIYLASMLFIQWINFLIIKIYRL